MCIMLTKESPTSTRLINIPVTLSGRKSKLLLYTNDLSVTSDRNALMIVPIPNPDCSYNFGLVSTSSPKMKNFRHALKLAFQTVNKKSKTRSRNYVLSMNSFREVHQIGNYNISIAKNLNELKSKIDWSKFDLPNDFDARFGTLSNSSIYNNCNYSYVIAQSSKSVKNDGFGIIYPDIGESYFPTAHEETITGGPVYYDVQIYNCINHSTPKFVSFANKEFMIKYLDTNKSKRLLEMIPTDCTLAEDGTRTKFKLNTSSLVFNHVKINCIGFNANIRMI